MTRVASLVAVLDRSRPVIVQAHDFPDHDAIGTAFAIAELLTLEGFETTSAYGGLIQSASLQDAVDALEIEVRPLSAVPRIERAQIVIVDGFAGNANVASHGGELCAVIDHHPPPSEPDTPYADIREAYGACASIAWEYWSETGREIPRRVATALLMGIMMDTAFMTRGVGTPDLDAFDALFRIGDWERAARLLRNSLSLTDLGTFRHAIDACTVAEDFAFVALEGPFTPEVVALVADFFLSMREIEFVVVVAGDRDQYRVSVRSEDAARPCDLVVQTALDGIGSGGGHIHMGGGSVPRDLYPGNEGLRRRFLVAFDPQNEAS